MQIANKTRKCINCGCVALLDSKICPKCGNNFINKRDDYINNISDLDQISRLLKILQFSNGVNIRFSFVNKSQIDVDIFSTCG